MRYEDLSKNAWFVYQHLLPSIDKVMSSNEVSTKVTHHLDVLGFYCPVPLHEMKKSLDQLVTGDIMQVDTDDPETLHDIPMYLGRTNHILHDVITSSGEFTFIIEVSK
jgi:tRNA 2-thiouridine synthesizing protein A